MSEKMRHILAIVVVLVFAASLFYIFVLPELSHTAVPVGQPSVATITLQVPDEPLIYSGGDFLPMEGVTATDEQGRDVSADVTVAIKKMAEATAYTLQYAYFGSRGERASASRRMEVRQYAGAPTIQVLTPLYEIHADDLATLTEQLHLLQLVRAEDGFGHDISTGITVTVKPANPDVPDVPNGKNAYIATLQVENFLGDSAEATLALQVIGAVTTTVPTEDW